MFTNSKDTLRLRKPETTEATLKDHRTLPAVPPAPAPETTEGAQPATTTSGRNVHTIKLDKEYFDRYKKRQLVAQTRKHDRNYRDGDLLIQLEYDSFIGVHTGRELISTITAITEPPGLEPGFILIHTKALA